jgi:hypothetical protein
MDKPFNKELFELTRVKIPENQIYKTGKAKKFFDILENSQNLTEEFLYAHQPLTNSVINIYSTSDEPVGALDKVVAENSSLNIISGPAIIVARKGYAGNLYVVYDEAFIVHEDAYPIKPKIIFKDLINLEWFVGQYSEEFQANRTSFWGIGDFPRTRFNDMHVVIPNIDFQNEIALLYTDKDKILRKLRNYKSSVLIDIEDKIKKHLDKESIYMNF